MARRATCAPVFADSIVNQNLYSRVAFISTEHSCEDSPRTFTAAEAAILQTKYDSLDALKAAVDQLAPGYALSILGNFRGAASEIVSYGCRAACCPFVLRGQRLSADKWRAPSFPSDVLLCLLTPAG